MSMTVKSYEQMLADMKERNVSNLDTSEGSFVDAVLRPVAFCLAAWNFDLAALAKQISPDTATGQYLENQAKDFGIERKPGTKATALVTFSGADGITVPKGTAVQTRNGLVFFTDADTTLSAGTATVGVTSEFPGDVCNVAENAICVMQSLTTVAITASTAAEGGTDVETDEELRQRLNSVRSRVPASCNEAQYEAWAMEVDGVGKARVLGRWNGPGTVKIVLVNEDMRAAEESTVQAVQMHLDPRREICTEVTCVPATDVEIHVEAQVVLADGFSAEQVQRAFGALVEKYLAGLALTGNPVVYNRIVYMLLSVEGVNDFLSLTVNGTEENLPLDMSAAPRVGTVSIT